MRKAKNNHVAWEDIKNLLSEEMGFWSVLPITWEQEKKLRDEYEKSFVRNKVEFAESMYAKTEPMAAKAKEVMDQIAMVGWTSGDILQDMCRYLLSVPVPICSSVKWIIRRYRNASQKPVGINNPLIYPQYSLSFKEFL